VFLGGRGVVEALAEVSVSLWVAFSAGAHRFPWRQLKRHHPMAPPKGDWQWAIINISHFLRPLLLNQIYGTAF